MPYQLRQTLLKLYRAAFRRCARKQQYRASFEPNHLAIRIDELPVITTVHDLSAVEHPHWHPIDRVKWYEHFVADTIDTTHAWITPSDFTRRRLCELWGARPDRVHVIPEAPRSLPFPTPDRAVQLAAAAGLPREFFLCLGTLEPRKNNRMLLDALSAMNPSDRRRCPLVFAGLPGWGSEDFWRSLVEHPQADRTLAAGYVSDRLAGLMLASATAVLVPSTYEGFGLPVLEAMTAGSPVICSDIPVFHEVAGKAAAFVRPDDAAGWAQAMTRAVHDETWRQLTSQSGLQRVGTFSWNRAARRHAELFSRICRE